MNNTSRTVALISLTLRITAQSLLTLFLLISTGCSTVDPVTGQSTRNMYSLADDIAMGSEVCRGYTSMMVSNRVSINQDTKKLEELRDITRRIAAVSNLPNLPYEVTLYQTNIVNAMAAPGGKIMVFEGLWNPKDGLVKDQDELAAVLAHEIAHVNCRHSTEAMTRAMPAQLLLAGVAVYAEMQDNDDLAAAAGAAFLLYQGLWVPFYSRRDELEADRVGMMYMAKAGYNPEAAPRIWKRVDEHKGSSAALSIFSTHPADGKRYNELMKALPEAQAVYRQTKPNL